MDFEASIEIARPPAAVWAYLADPAHLPEWVEGIVDFDLRDDGRFRQVLRQHGRDLAMEGRVTDAREGECVAMRLEGDEGVLEAEHRLRPSERGTHLVHRARLTLSNPVLRLVSKGMREPARRRLHDDLLRLRTVLEREA